MSLLCPYIIISACHMHYIVCMWLFTAISYTGPPPAPVIGTDFSISRSPEEDDNSTFKFMISWNSSSAFTGTNAVTSYIVTPPTITTEGRDVAVDCPPSCSLDAPCQCSTGLRLEERIIINISAINCGTQQGEAVEVTVASCRLYYHKYISY